MWWIVFVFSMPEQLKLLDARDKPREHKEWKLGSDPCYRTLTPRRAEIKTKIQATRTMNFGSKKLVIYIRTGKAECFS